MRTTHHFTNFKKRGVDQKVGTSSDQLRGQSLSFHHIGEEDARRPLLVPVLQCTTVTTLP